MSAAGGHRSFVTYADGSPTVGVGLWLAGVLLATAAVIAFVLAGRGTALGPLDAGELRTAAVLGGGLGVPLALLGTVTALNDGAIALVATLGAVVPMLATGVYVNVRTLAWAPSRELLSMGYAGGLLVLVLSIPLAAAAARDPTARQLPRSTRSAATPSGGEPAPTGTELSETERVGAAERSTDPASGSDDDGVRSGATGADDGTAAEDVGDGDGADESPPRADPSAWVDDPESPPGADADADTDTDAGTDTGSAVDSDPERSEGKGEGGDGTGVPPEPADGSGGRIGSPADVVSEELGIDDGDGGGDPGSETGSEGDSGAGPTAGDGGDDRGAGDGGGDDENESEAGTADADTDEDDGVDTAEEFNWGGRED